jgi:hypothetical protein
MQRGEGTDRAVIAEHLGDHTPQKEGNYSGKEQQRDTMLHMSNPTLDFAIHRAKQPDRAQASADQLPPLCYNSNLSSLPRHDTLASKPDAPSTDRAQSFQ